jgi:hypothetical protein
MAPMSLQLSDVLSMIGYDEGNVTYPEFYYLKSGDLLFVYRSGTSGNGNMVINHYSTAVKKWERMQDVLLDGEGKRNAYWQLYLDGNSILHLSWVWRESPSVETNHDLCYARSRDNGVTWEKANGEQYNLPITVDNAEYACIIPQGSELINQTSMTVDSTGMPYIASYWKDEGSDIPQYRIVWFDGITWQQTQVSNRSSSFSLSGTGTLKIPISRPLVLATKAREIIFIFRDEERGSVVSLAYSDDIISDNWTYFDLTDFSVDAWEPTYDTELWKQTEELNLFVQRTGQGNHETSIDIEPQMVYVAEVRLDYF